MVYKDFELKFPFLSLNELPYKSGTEKMYITSTCNKYIDGVFAEKLNIKPSGSLSSNGPSDSPYMFDLSIGDYFNNNIEGNLNISGFPVSFKYSSNDGERRSLGTLNLTQKNNYPNGLDVSKEFYQGKYNPSDYCKFTVTSNLSTKFRYESKLYNPGTSLEMEDNFINPHIKYLTFNTAGTTQLLGTKLELSNPKVVLQQGVSVNEYEGSLRDVKIYGDIETYFNVTETLNKLITLELIKNLPEDGNSEILIGSIVFGIFFNLKVYNTSFLIYVIPNNIN